LIRTQANLQGLLHCASAAFIVLNGEGYIQSFNQVGEKLLYYAEAEVLEKKPDKLF